MRTNEGRRTSHKTAALTHQVVADELNTAAAVADSGEVFRELRGAVERGKGVRRERGEWRFWGGVREVLGCSECARRSWRSGVGCRRFRGSGCEEEADRWDPGPLINERDAAGLRLGCWPARVGWLAGFWPSWLVCPFFFVLFIFLFLFSVFRFSNLNLILF